MVLLRYLFLGIGVAGVAVIAWGVVLALAEFVRLEYNRFHGEDICRPREILRHHLGSYLLLGLELLIAADIIATIISPTLKEVTILGSIVGIRTIINYFLNREIASHTCRTREG